jgi:hypothetical protein
MSQAKKLEDRLELVGQVLIGSQWSLATRSPLATVLKAGYFATKHPDRGLKKGDLIFVVSDYDADEPTFATLAVISAGAKGAATVKQL